MSADEFKDNPLVQYFEKSGYIPEIVGDRKVFKYFESTKDEINSLNEGVGLRELSGCGIFELEGKDVLDFFHRISTNSLRDVQANSVAQTIFTTEKGRIIDSAVIINFDDHQLLICSQANKFKIRSWIEKYIITDDVKINDTAGKYMLLEILGPQADSFMTLVCGNAVNEVKMNKFKSVISEGVLFYMTKLKERNGNLKFWLWLNPENGVKLVDFMMKNKGVFNFNIIGEEAYTYYRVLQGIPVSPNEINDLFNPHEANLTDLVSFTKGCYIGQEVIARLDTYEKVQKHLTGIKFIEPVKETSTFNLFDEAGNDAGTVTSVVYSEKCKKSFGLAYVRNTYLRAGTELISKDDGGKIVKVIVESLPFHKNQLSK
jgi:folate-binding protein YgfZ